jgi:hypothetical protein
MAIDVLSRENCIPIVVGDEADMADVVGVGTAGGAAHLIMTNEDGKTHKVALSPQAAKNFATSEYVLLVSLTPEDEIASAYKMPINDPDKPMEALDEPQIKELAEALVAGDFNLDYLR